MVRASDAAVYDPTALHAEPLILCEGKPSCNNILQAIALSCLYAPKGNNGRPYKPGSLKISYRCRGQVSSGHNGFRRAWHSATCVQHCAWLCGWEQQQGCVLITCRSCSTARHISMLVIGAWGLLCVPATYSAHVSDLDNQTSKRDSRCITMCL